MSEHLLTIDAGTGSVRAVMFDVMKLRANNIFLNAQCAPHIVFQIANLRGIT